MNHARMLIFALPALALATAASAYTTKMSNGETCDTSNACHVYCNDGNYVGAMYWNGAKWSDGLRSDKDKDVVAKQMVAAQGKSCQ